jgi:hypothetical protein
MDGMSLLDVLRGVMLDQAEQAAYNADPGAYLQRYGYDDVDPADLSEAFGLVADTLPPDQAQAAWQAATSPDNGSFGTVTADFDGDGIADANAATPGAEAADQSPAGSNAAPDAEPTLSFGEGEVDTSDLDDPTFDDGPAEVSGGLAGDGAHGDGDLADELDPGDTDLDDTGGELDDGLDDTGGELDDGLDDTGGELDHALDDTGGELDDGLDDLDDLGQIDGLGGLDDQGPDDTDIGSF